MWNNLVPRYRFRCRLCPDRLFQPAVYEQRNVCVRSHCCFNSLNTVRHGVPDKLCVLASSYTEKDSSLVASQFSCHGGVCMNACSQCRAAWLLSCMIVLLLFHYRLGVPNVFRFFFFFCTSRVSSAIDMCLYSQFRVPVAMFSPFPCLFRFSLVRHPFNYCRETISFCSLVLGALAANVSRDLLRCLRYPYLRVCVSCSP